MDFNAHGAATTRPCVSVCVRADVKCTLEERGRELLSQGHVYGRVNTAYGREPHEGLSARRAGRTMVVFARSERGV